MTRVCPDPANVHEDNVVLDLIAPVVRSHCFLFPFPVHCTQKSEGEGAYTPL